MSGGREPAHPGQLFVTAFLFIMGLKRMSSPSRRAAHRPGRAPACLVATLFTFLYPGPRQLRVDPAGDHPRHGPRLDQRPALAMTDMPQMNRALQRLRRGAAAAIAAVELYRGEAMSLEPWTSLAVSGP